MDYNRVGLYPGGTITGRIFMSQIWWDYNRVGLYPGGAISGILRYVNKKTRKYEIWAPSLKSGQYSQLL